MTRPLGRGESHPTHAVPAYARFLESEIKHLGRNHPIIRTQYFCEEIDAQLGMFNAARRALMQGDEPPMSSPLNPQDLGEVAEGRRGFAFLLDIAGQDEARMSPDETAPEVVPVSARGSPTPAGTASA